ncbi:cell death abnormality protein 1-like [Ruditapes philippinarum]|uniref:cell death abnormality protein 1-like n=1 Tax=Ruditapes philippinarum TaxID=129788 RepID=UPI00295B8884|nr:cell death abnormality protein 1-like [Ruditapes philippinarum]XP_060566995.1 cell death abnormality protein 1-like [Ruditapes philippinarum]
MESAYLCLLVCVIVVIVDFNQCDAVTPVIGKACNSSTESTVCTLKHSVCTSSACACETGYTNKKNQCLTVLGTPCGSTNASTVCTTKNSGCSTAGKCFCPANYVEEDGMCPNALGQTCIAATDCVSNADCDTTVKTCKCKAGFVDTSGLCAKPSSAVTIKITLSTFGILMFLNVILKAF